MRILQGTIVSNKMRKTVVVRVDRIKRHPRYLKRYRISRKYKADAGDAATYRIGDVVRIAETRPLSREKRWRVTALVRRSEPEDEASEGTQSVTPDTQNGIAPHSTEEL